MIFRYTPGGREKLGVLPNNADHLLCRRIIVSSACIVTADKCQTVTFIILYQSLWPHCRLSDTIHWTNIGLMLGQRRRRWLNIKPVFGQCILFAGILSPARLTAFPTKHIPSYTAGTMVGECRARWANIKSILCHSVVFAGLH